VPVATAYFRSEEPLIDLKSGTFRCGQGRKGQRFDGPLQSEECGVKLRCLNKTRDCNVCALREMWRILAERNAVSRHVFGHVWFSRVARKRQH
jgi:hypothetical protein